MNVRTPDISLILAACLTDCFQLSKSSFAPSLHTLAPACQEFDPLLLHTLLSGDGDEPRRDLLRQASEAVGLTPSQDVFTRPLHSVFDRVVLRDDPAAGERVYAQTRWSEVNNTIFPTSLWNVSLQSRDILADFLERWLTFAQRAATPDALLAGTFGLIDEYLWCLPADMAQKDVPLSDMLRLRSAAAACLWQRSQMTETLPELPFRLVSGDLSGIQSYLFGITEGGKGESGTAKRLRARSLFVQLLAEVGIWKVLSAYALPPCNVLMASGGKFMILCPNLPEQDDPLPALRQEIDAWLRTELHGTIGLSFASIPLAAGELRRGFGKVIERIEGELFRQKHRPLTTQLQTHGGWNEDAFIIPEDFPHEVCPSCQTFPRSGPDTFCRQCQTDKQIGTVMAHHPKWLAFFDSPPQHNANTLNVLNMTVQVIAQRDDVRQTPDLLMQLGGALDLDSAATHCPIIWRQSAPYVNNRLSFSPMAQQGEGRALLGYVKADVDHLGMIFQWGLQRDSGPGYDTPARFSALSHQLDRFFNGWLSHYLAQQYAESYTVFAGGDDLFLIGHWETMLRGIQDIRTEFRAFSGQHPHVTLSAGIAMVKEKYPLAHAAREAEKQVEHAKQQAALERQKGQGRDQIALLGDVLSWEAFAQVLQDQTLLKTEMPHAAFLYALLRYASMWRQFKTPVAYQLVETSFQKLQRAHVPEHILTQLHTLKDHPFETREKLFSKIENCIGKEQYLHYQTSFEQYAQAVHDTLQLRFQPYLAYNVTRNIKRDTLVWKWAEKLVKLVITKETTHQQLDHLGTIAQLALFHKQGGEVYGT